MNKFEEDFGFSFVDEDFVPPVAKEKIDNDFHSLATERDELRSKLKLSVRMILPLLNKLIQDPEKPTIYWPDHSERTKAFKSKYLEALGMKEEDV